MRFLKWLAVIVLILIVIYFLGPRPSPPLYQAQLPVITATGTALDSLVAAGENRHHLKPDNEARIIWANDSLKQKTAYAFVYLHGFSASQEEGAPIHEELARRYGCNLYLSRLAEHGIDTTEPLASLTADKLWESAKQAYVIGKQLGNKVILVSTSTGGTLALKLAAQYPDIAALLLFSPNIAINDPNAWLLNNPWGLQIAHLVKGEYNQSSDTRPIYRQYWNYRYRMEAAVQLEELLETSMKAGLFARVQQPVLLLYYYKDEDHQDPVVKVSAMQRMFRQLGTPDSLRREMALPNTGDHVIGSHIKSHDLDAVRTACYDFADHVLNLQAKPPAN